MILDSLSKVLQIDHHIVVRYKISPIHYELETIIFSTQTSSPCATTYPPYTKRKKQTPNLQIWIIRISEYEI